MIFPQESSNHSLRSTIMKEGEPKTRESPKSVSFAQAETEFQEVHRRCDLSEEEKHAIWYDKREYREMKKDYSVIVKKMVKCQPLDADEDSRGLEHKTPRGGKKRLKNIFMVIDTVLDTQERQFEENRPDPTYLAEIYTQASRHCLERAYETAQGDERYVKEHVIQDSGSNTSQAPLRRSESLEWDSCSFGSSEAENASVSTLSSTRLKTFKSPKVIFAAA